MAMEHHRSYEAAISEYTEGRLNPLPEYYGGMGPSRSIIDDRVLTAIAQGIKEEFGAEDMDYFVLFVDSLPDLRPTTFLIGFILWWGNDRRGTYGSLANTFEFLNPNKATPLQQLIASVLESKHDSRQDNRTTGHIKEDFHRTLHHCERKNFRVRLSELTRL